jgi:hypothetical protein
VVSVSTLRTLGRGLSDLSSSRPPPHHSAR